MIFRYSSFQASTMHTYSVLGASGLRPVFLHVLSLIFQGIAAGIGTSNFLCVSFNNFLDLLICWINEVNIAQSSSVIKLRFLDSPFLFLFSLRCFWHFCPYPWSQVIRPWCRLFLYQPLPGPCIPIWRFFFQEGESFESCTRFWKVSGSVDISIIGWRRSSITSKVVLVALVTSMYRSGIWNDSSLGTYSLLAVQRDDGKCSCLKWTKNHFLLHHHHAMSFEKVVKTRLILLEDVLVLLLGLGGPRLRWMSSEPGLLQIVWLFHLRSEM